MSQERHSFDSEIEEEVENDDEQQENQQPEHRRVITENLDDKELADGAADNPQPQNLVPPQQNPLIPNNQPMQFFNMPGYFPEAGSDLLSQRQYFPLFTFPLGLMAMPNAHYPQQGLSMFINFNANILGSNQNYGRMNIQQQNQQQIKKKYYELRKSPIDSRRDQVDLTQPHLKVSFVKQQEFNNDQNYIITEFGLQYSQKNTTVEDIMIGRQHIYTPINDNQQVYPNDIVLPINDRAISRVHCKLITSEGFIKKKCSIQMDFFSFLCYQEKYQRKFPLYILKIIQDFTKQTPLFYIQDLGSVQGTYLKVRNNKEQVIEKGNTFFIGADTQFHITDCRIAKDEKIPREQLEAEFAEGQLNAKIHGYNAEEEQKLKFKALRVQRPMIKVTFSNMVPTIQTNQIFYAKVNENDELQGTLYKFGRNQDSDVTINYNTISRKQCRIRYCPLGNNWLISDGEAGRESANGTWLSLTDYHEKFSNNQREESKKKLIDNGAEIKISESVLKVEMINFDQRKPYFTQKERKMNTWNLIQQ